MKEVNHFMTIDCPINISIEEEKAEALKSLKQFKASKVHLLWDKFYPDYFEVSDRLDSINACSTNSRIGRK